MIHLQIMCLILPMLRPIYDICECYYHTHTRYSTEISLSSMGLALSIFLGLHGSRKTPTLATQTHTGTKILTKEKGGNKHKTMNKGVHPGYSIVLKLKFNL